MRALLGVSCLLALMDNDPAMSPGPMKSAASVARMSEAISGAASRKIPACRYAHAGYLLRGKTVEMPGRKHNNLPV
jgi:hypothetical protein